MTVLDDDLNYIAEKLKELEIRDRKIFVTGATGLLGSILIKAIQRGNIMHKLNNHVIALVRNTKKVGEIFTDQRDVELCVGDILNPVLYDGTVDFIIHTACETKSLQMINSPVETLWTSLAGSRNILEFAKVKNIEKMVYLSSIEVFGDTGDRAEKVNEEQLGDINLGDVRSCYPESKRMVENMCVCYAAEYHVPVVSARLAQTFGAGVSKEDPRIFAQIGRSVINGENIVLHTLGISYGNYVYIAEAAEALFTLLAKGKDGEVYTIANEESTMTIMEMAQMVADKIAEGKIKVIIEIPENQKFGYAANTKLKLDASKMRELGWQPKINLENTYRRMICDWEGHICTKQRFSF